MRATLVQWVATMSPEVFTALAIGLVVVVTIAIVLAVREPKTLRPDEWLQEGNIRQ